MAWHDGLTEKQRTFCETYAENGGNAYQAAIKAGYASPQTQCHRLSENVVIRAALEKLREVPTKQRIATREERQSFWTQVMADSSQDMKNRLKASELLGRAHVDFVERHEHKLIDLSEAEIDERIARLVSEVGAPRAVGAEAGDTLQ